MQSWKQAYSLAKFELSESKIGFCFAFIFSMFILLFITTSLPSYLDNGFVGLDFFFVLLFSIATIWAKPKNFQSQKINEQLNASPQLVMQKQLPIQQNVIIKSRFIIHFFYSFPFQLTSLIALYFFTPLQTMLSIGAYISFGIIWLSFGIYAGYIFPASDAGDNRFTTSNLAIILIVFTTLIALFLIFIFIHFLFDNGIVYWSIVFAQKWPLLSAIISILLAIFGFKHWEYHMKKTMKKIDYL